MIANSLEFKGLNSPQASLNPGAFDRKRLGGHGGGDGRGRTSSQRVPPSNIRRSKRRSVTPKRHSKGAAAAIEQPNQVEFDRWALDLKSSSTLSAYKDYRFGIIMPAAAKNLATVLVQEKLDLPMAKSTFHEVLLALDHLHVKDLLHADFKPLNVMRMPDGMWKLIDLDGVVKIGDPIGAKALSTAFMPPEATFMQDEQVMFRVRNSSALYEALKAHPSLDLWSATVVLYRAVTHKPLLEADDRDNLRGKRELKILATWGPKALSEALTDTEAALLVDGIGAIERLVVLDLLSWGLQHEPVNRPQSCADMLAHPFFDEANLMPSRRRSARKSASGGLGAEVEEGEEGDGGGEEEEEGNIGGCTNGSSHAGSPHRRARLLCHQVDGHKGTTQPPSWP